jgi:hypothetical protein
MEALKPELLNIRRLAPTRLVPSRITVTDVPRVAPLGHTVRSVGGEVCAWEREQSPKNNRTIAYEQIVLAICFSVFTVSDLLSTITADLVKGD